MKNKYLHFLSLIINPSTNIKFNKQILLGLIIIVVHIQISCKENIIDNPDNIIGPIPGEWVSYGFEDKIPYRMVLDETILYACAGKDGLWRKDISNSSSSWQYLGLADSSGLFPPKHTVSDVDVYNDTLLAAMYWLNEREEYNDVGIWKSTNNGLTWVRSDSGIARSNWSYSSMWAVKRSPYNPLIVISAVGTTFRSIDAGSYWYQVDPADTSGRGESFILRILWHKKRDEEVWIYGQGNIFGPALVVSKDWGQTWSHLSLDIRDETPVNEIAFDAILDNYLYLACDYGILCSSSSGKDWINQNWQTPPYILSSNGEFAFTGLATHPKISGEAYFGGGNNIYVTKDFGESFYLNKIPNNSTVRNLVYTLKQDMIIIGTNTGIMGFKISR